MSTEFSRSMRALAADGFRGSAWGGLLALALLGAWAAWFFLARVALYEVSQMARLEVDRAVHPVEAPVAGRIVATRLALGREVQAGEVLVELDAGIERLRLEEERTHLVALPRQLEALRGEILSEERSLLEEQQAGRAALEEARTRHQEAEVAAQLAREEAERLRLLHADGLIAEIDFLRARAEAQRRQAAAEAFRLAVGRLEWDQRTRESHQRARLERLRREGARLEGQRATTAIAIRRLQRETERRRILAPVAGRIVEVANRRVGEVVSEGGRLGSVAPAGRLKIVADFLPSAAVGRVRPGQPARLRLHGYPWTQYGSLPATVARVASEARSGRVRVELALPPNPASRIPLQHGLPGTIEIRVDRVSPATLVLRLAGKLLTARETPPGARDGLEGNR